MNAGKHRWGESQAADEVWKLVLGLDPRIAGQSVLVSLVAYIDDSRAANGGAFALGGHIATVETWAALSEDWRELLPLCPLNKHGRREFKMSEMMKNPDRIANIQPFFRLIEKYKLTSISVAIKVAHLERARARIMVPGVKIDWADFNRPYIFLYRALMDLFHEHRDTLPLQEFGEEQVDFVFDEQSEGARVLATWHEYVSRRKERVRRRFGQMPVFRNSEKFMPLQAADLWAGVARMHGMDDDISTLGRPDFGSWRAADVEGRVIHHGRWNENQLVTSLKEFLRPQLVPSTPIIDTRYGF